MLRSLNRLKPRALLISALILCDVIGVNAGFVGSYIVLYDREIAGIYRAPDPRAVAQFLLLLNLACFLIFMAYRLYIFKRAGSRVDEAYKVFIALTIATLGASVIATIRIWLSYVRVTLLPAASPIAVRKNWLPTACLNSSNEPSGCLNVKPVDAPLLLTVRVGTV